MSAPNWFIALPVPAEQLPDDALDSLPEGVRAFHPLDLHITVAFLGPVSRERALAAWDLHDWSSEPGFHVYTTGRAALGRKRRPSAYGLDVGDADGRLQQFVQDWRDRLLDAANRPAEKRDVRPHVTLGRPARGRSDTIRHRQWLAKRQPPAEITLERIALYTWAEQRRDRRFTHVRECELAGMQGPQPESTEDD